MNVKYVKKFLYHVLVIKNVEANKEVPSEIKICKHSNTILAQHYFPEGQRNEKLRLYQMLNLSRV